MNCFPFIYIGEIEQLKNMELAASSFNMEKTTYNLLHIGVMDCSTFAVDFNKVNC